MRMLDLIEKKREGQALSTEEIHFFIDGYTRDQIPDYQVSALLMAIYFKGMTDQEISDLTMAMVDSGDTVDLSPIKGIKVDKHSTGGVGDKTSLIVGPLVAAAGVPVAKMSGRGLGHTGGTIDKLEAIPGFHIELSRDEFIEHVNTHKIAIVGQSGNLTPADKKLYALRDVTGTVASIPLIASSIMSKKIASGADSIVLDVKVGSGAFMKTLEDARRLAAEMVSIGKSLNRQTIAVLSDMNQPLGREVGNANEVREAIDVLKGQGEERLTEVCLTIASQMVVAGGIYKDVESAHEGLQELISSGQALEQFKTFVQAQGGDPAVIDDPSQLPEASQHIKFQTDQEGYVHSIDAEQVGLAAMLLGAGRQQKEDAIDYAVGITLLKKVGDPINIGDTLAVLHCQHPSVAEALEKLEAAYQISSQKPEEQPIIYDIIK
ncbi:pyrimidine-nucleoside phosphorylase [Pullulanibacillus pueri]|uniref:Pyrimidine-nucleoside phosphorylase n=1 Tax=Pullulanibacillus pueri TaxID=1437324 RepID=A0A8J2ZUX1_9BACL|nr:pyrimidine-nucleoside phosphorylase [Pullulanibacillus pueri]MBM7681668.1 pyrimidine-nucleoside phosphorylase [Pullulanibacillus pueri]GGH79241.1 pyrimidine-nucleoside phosphorylase [Pullulanibacillus pueri]